MGSAGRRRVWSFPRTVRKPVLLKPSVGWGEGGEGDDSREAGKGSGGPLKGLRNGADLHVKKIAQGAPGERIGVVRKKREPRD